MWGIFAVRSRKSRHKQRAAPGEPARCVDSAERAASVPGVAKVSRAPGHNSWAVCSAEGCAAERAVNWDACRRLAFGQPVQLGHCCLVRLCAHVERVSTYACSVPRFAVVRRSESVVGVRFRSCSCETAARIFAIRGWARAELGSTFEPCHVSGCFEHAKTHRN